MKEEYDFSNGIRGRFYKPGVGLRLPVYLDAKVQSRLEIVAEKEGMEAGALVNKWVKSKLDAMKKNA